MCCLTVIEPFVLFCKILHCVNMTLLCSTVAHLQERETHLSQRGEDEFVQSFVL